MEPALVTDIGSGHNIRVKSDASAEKYSQQAIPYYTPESSAIVQVIAGEVGMAFNQWDGTWDGPRIGVITLGKAIHEK